MTLSGWFTPQRSPSRVLAEEISLQRGRLPARWFSLPRSEACIRLDARADGFGPSRTARVHGTRYGRRVNHRHQFTRRKAAQHNPLETNELQSRKKDAQDVKPLYLAPQGRITISRTVGAAMSYDAYGVWTEERSRRAAWVLTSCGD